MNRSILFLDDDRAYVETLAELAAGIGLASEPCSRISDAEHLLRSADVVFAFVDVYLVGTDPRPANEFVQEILVPRGVPFVRMTNSDAVLRNPSILAPELRGELLLSKLDVAAIRRFLRSLQQRMSAV